MNIVNKPYFMNNKEWYYWEYKEWRYKLTKEAPPMAIISYNEFYKNL